MASSPAERLRKNAQRFVRRYGLLASDQTPCGQPISIAYAQALFVLRERGECTQQQIAEELGVDKSTAARLCARMEEAGHAAQRVNHRDARSRVVGLTARGTKLAGQVDAASVARFEAILEAIPPGRRDDVIDALSVLATALEQVPSTTTPSKEPQ